MMISYVLKHRKTSKNIKNIKIKNIRTNDKVRSAEPSGDIDAPSHNTAGLAFFRHAQEGNALFNSGFL
jgi:hypothetical protein